MTAFIQTLFLLMKPYRTTIFAIIAAIVVAFVLYYAYYNVYIPAQKKAQLKDIANSGATTKTLVIYMFHVDWCPHCKKALPEWTMFKDEYNGKQVNGFIVECQDIDCTDKNNTSVSQLLDKYKVEQYPTIKGVVPVAGGKDLEVEYDAKVTKTNLEQFVMSIATDN